jgi:hypothetical protein
MKRLSREQFQRAREFLGNQARPLDRTLFEHRFGGAHADAVLAELARFRNPDGGFGRALEPDVRTPSSSALCTGIALTVLREMDCPGDHPLVAGAVQFLLSTFDEDERGWRVIPQDANDYPHAPWWHDEAGSLARTFDDFKIIPRSQIVGLLNYYAKNVPAGWLAALTEETASAILALEEEAFGGGGDSLCYALSLAETEALGQPTRDALVRRLRALSDKIVCRDPEKWGEYCASPLKVAPSPESAVAELLRADLQRQLDYQIDRQRPDGAWDPTWTWGDSYTKTWQRAKQEWRGHLTLEMLTTLRAFERIDE